MSQDETTNNQTSPDENEEMWEFSVLDVQEYLQDKKPYEISEDTPRVPQHEVWCLNADLPLAYVDPKDHKIHPTKVKIKEVPEGLLAQFENGATALVDEYDIIVNYPALPDELYTFTNAAEADWLIMPDNLKALAVLGFRTFRDMEGTVLFYPFPEDDAAADALAEVMASEDPVQEAYKHQNVVPESQDPDYYKPASPVPPSPRELNLRKVVSIDHYRPSQG